jgi:hypothetical protein
MMGKYYCYDCSVTPFETKDELAKHILANPNETHPRLRIWAEQYVNTPNTPINKAYVKGDNNDSK